MDSALVLCIYFRFPTVDTTRVLQEIHTDSAFCCRHSFEYSDRDEMMVAHIVGGFDAFIKLPQGWPMLTCALKLISLKSSENHSRAISLSFICKVEEMANSLDVHTRQNLLSFADAIEEILVQQMRSEL
ncbi:hypothetical protein Scep_010606 [Stephania cephalantha]|uniref:Uncharacterized protein n=1 Tax=Stephania cephalantha TaxID=152367 RepID=A0AAP0JXM6_9MAGN